VSSTSPPTEYPPSRRKASAPDGAAAERQLARWIAEGDEAALGELYDLLGPTLYAVALGISRDVRHAEAAVEESFAELWDKRAGLGRLPALSPWLVERCRAWSLALTSGTAGPGPKPLQDRAGDIPLTRRFLRCPPSQRTSRIKSALERLGPREREVILLASRGGFSVAEIARRMGERTETVQALMQEGLRLLRKDLEHTLRREAV
jgi:RNA polymerase sigma-70 factor (ECF subfamily)